MRKISLTHMQILGLTTLLGTGLLAGCSSDSPTAGENSFLAVQLTDAPTDEVSEIQVYIAGLTVKHDQMPVERIAADIGLVDLLTLTGGATELLATVPAEPGTYQFIQVELDETQSFVIETATGDQKPLQIASDEIKVVGGFEVFEDMTTTLTLDFDAEQSLVQLGNGDWLMKPVIVLDGVDQS